MVAKIDQLHQAHQTLKKQYKRATEKEKQPLAELHNILQKKLITSCSLLSIFPRPQRLQALPRASPASSEDLESHLAKGASGRPERMWRWGLDPKRLKNHQPVLDILTAECVREGSGARKRVGAIAYLVLA